MDTELTIETERVDDIPLLLAEEQRMGLAELLNEHFPTHGNWQGLSLGHVVEGWLAYILSAADHRLSYVQGWAAGRLRTLRGSLGEPVRALDFSDDRLEIVLGKLSQDEAWVEFERALNARSLRVYALPTHTVRLDTTTCSGYWTITEDGLFQLGYSKDHRPDLPQVKVMLATVDPLGMPVAVDVVAGQHADDPLYIPAIRRVRESVPARGLLYVGDSKMGARATRGYIQAGGDHYLVPLSRVQLPATALTAYLRPVWKEQQAVQEICRKSADGQRKVIAAGFERETQMQAMVKGEMCTWQERHLVVRSMQQVRAAKTRLQQRLTAAQQALADLNRRGRGRKRYTCIYDMWQAAEKIVQRYHVKPFLHLQYTLHVERRLVRRYRERPTRVVESSSAHLDVTVDKKAVARYLQRQGWRVYATSAPAHELPLARAILAYRDQYIVEQTCGRLKGKPVAVTPMYLERDDYATGLLRLLSLGVRLLTVLEFQVRRRLATQETDLRGLYAGNPTRATQRPTAEQLLTAFKEITLTVIHLPQHLLLHTTPLSDLQHRILSLLDLPSTIYTCLEDTHLSQPP